VGPDEAEALGEPLVRPGQQVEGEAAWPCLARGRRDTVLRRIDVTSAHLVGAPAQILAGVTGMEVPAGDSSTAPRSRVSAQTPKPATASAAPAGREDKPDDRECAHGDRGPSRDRSRAPQRDGEQDEAEHLAADVQHEHRSEQHIVLVVVDQRDGARVVRPRRLVQQDVVAHQEQRGERSHEGDAGPHRRLPRLPCAGDGAHEQDRGNEQQDRASSSRTHRIAERLLAASAT
jgi:hypothetical protein